MVEHRTENSGVRGSNPFIGIVFTVKKLNKNKLLTALLRSFLISSFNNSNLLTTKLAQFLLPTAVYTINWQGYNACSRLYYLNNNNLTKSFFKKLKKKKNGKRRAEFLKKHTQLQLMAANFVYMYPLLNRKRGEYFPAPIYDSLKSFWWYKFYLKAVTQQYTLFKSNWILTNCSSLVLQGNYLHVYRALYNRHYLQKLYCKPEKFLFWFTKLTVFKDLSSFVPMILKWLVRSSLKKHKRIFVLINKFFKVWYDALEEFKKIRGYCIFFKGKLGKKGSVRKSKYFAKRGEVSYSTKSLRVNYKTFHFGTITGVVGGGLSIFYTISLTFCFLYIYIYVITLFFLLLFFITFKITNLFSQINFAVLWQALNFFREGWVFKLLILQLAGLPPMFIFFIKFSFLVTAFNVSTIFVCFLILINLIGGMLFYLQLFKLSSAVDKKEILTLITKNSTLRLRSKQSVTNIKFLFMYLTVSFFFLNWFSGFFFIDIYVLLNGILL